jgi:broad specificity phosphatase PhoE
MPLVPASLLLIRHAESPHNLEPRLVSATATGLTPLGLRQAAWLADHLAGWGPIDALYASTMDRARRTADAVAARTGLAVRPVDDLREWDFGDCEGMTMAEVEARYPDLFAPAGRDDPDWGWPGGESRGAFYARAVRAVGEIAIRHDGGTAAVVSHNGLLTSYLAQAIDGTPWTFERYAFGHCMIADVEVDRGVARIVGRTGCAAEV